MSEKKSNWLLGIVVVLLLLQLASDSHIQALKNQITSLQNQVAQSENNISRYLDSSIASLREDLAKEASILDSYTYTYGQLDAAAKTIDLTFTVNPKALSAATTAGLQLGQAAIPMERVGDSFVATVAVDVFNSLQPRVSLTENGVSRQESLDMTLEPRYEALPQLFAWLERGGGTEVESAATLNEDAYYYLSGTVIINQADKSSGSNQGSFSNLRVEVLVDGETVFTRQAEDFSSGEAEKYLSFEEPVKIPLRPGQSLSVRLLAEDNYGLTHQVILEEMELDENGSSAWWGTSTNSEIILDDQGNRLWPEEW